MLFEKQKIQQCFNKAAATYDQAAILQHETGKALIAQLPLVLAPQHILDVGAGTGYCTHLLAELYPGANIIGLDFADKMLGVAKQKMRPQTHYLCADFDYLPLKDASVDLIYSNFSFQWSLDLAQTFAAAYAVLKHNGHMVFSTLGPKTLYELREASKKIDDSAHLNDFLSMSVVQDHLQACGFKIITLSSHEQALVFDDLLELIHNLKKIGANHVVNKDVTGLGNKYYFEQLVKHYQAFKMNEQLPATYDIIYGVVQK
jgi:malonyl-CoA O-methyltransferase